MFLWVPVFLGIGMGAYFSLKFEPDIPLGIAGLFAFLFVVTALLIKSTSVKLIAMLLVLSGFGLSLASLRAHGVKMPVLSEPYFGTVEGTVAKLDRSQSNRLRITLEDIVLYGVEPELTPKLVRVTLPRKDATATIGARIMIYTRLEGPGPPVEPGGFDFRRWAWFHQLGGVGYALGPQLRSPSPVDRTFALRTVELRLALADMIRERIPGRNGAFAAAILTGDRSAIDPALLHNLRASNLAHLLAISGLHMGLLTGFIFGLVRYGIALFPPLALRVSGKKVGAIAAIPAGLAYLVISGASIATQRAYVMALVILIAVILDRPAFTLRAVALAALIILVVSPESVTQVGFQMSFAATVGLVYGFELLRHTKIWRRPAKGWHKLAKGVFSVAFSSFVAGAATAPFAAFHFNQMAQYGLLANLLAVPLMGSLVMPAAITALLLTPVGLAAPFYFVAGQGIGAILEIARWVAEMEGAVVKIASGPAIVLPIFTLGCLFTILWIGRMRYVGIPVAAVALGIWAMSERPTVLISSTGGLVGIQTADGRVLNKPRGDGFTANSWLENDGDTAVQKIAAGRQGFEGGKDEISFISRDFSLLRTESASVRAVSNFCEAFDIVVAPKLNKSTATDCVIISSDTLTEAGAIAIRRNEEALQITSTRDVSGQRLWTMR